MRKLLKDKKAITLIALVITIVVLVILAAVTISMTVGNDGLIAKAIKAANDYKNSKTDEKQGINDLYGQLVVASDGTISGLTLDDLNTYINNKIAPLQTTINDLNTKISEIDTIETILGNDNKVYKKNCADSQSSNVSASKTVTSMNVEQGNYLVMANVRVDTISGRQFFSVTGGNNYCVGSANDSVTLIGYANNVTQVELKYVRESGYYNNLYATLIAVKVD